MDLSWAPSRVVPGVAPAELEWLYTGEERWLDPFYDELLERHARRPFGVLFRPRTPLDELDAGADPAGIVLHTGRCGSTLVCRMLAGSGVVGAIAEPRLLSEVLWLPVPEAIRVEWFRRLVRALCRPRAGERHVILKLAPPELFVLPLVREAFPGVPIAFVAREPLEVLVSLSRGRPARMAPGGISPQFAGMTPDMLAVTAPEEYDARLLGAILDAASRQLDERDLVVDYDDLPDAALARVAPHFGIELTDDERRLARDAASRDAKHPGLPFRDDRAAKRAAATDEIREAAARFADRAYRELLHRSP